MPNARKRISCVSTEKSVAGAFDVAAVGAAVRSGVCAEGCTNVVLGRVASKEMSLFFVQNTPQLVPLYGIPYRGTTGMNGDKKKIPPLGGSITAYRPP